MLDFAFRSYHKIEMPDAYEQQFIRWAADDTEDQFNFNVKYSLNRKWFENLFTYEVRGKTL